MDKDMIKRVTVIPPIITPFSSRMKLRRDNERLILRLEQLERGPFGIKKWFKCDKS